MPLSFCYPTGVWRPTTGRLYSQVDCIHDQSLAQNLMTANLKQLFSEDDRPVELIIAPLFSFLVLVKKAKDGDGYSG